MSKLFNITKKSVNSIWHFYVDGFKSMTIGKQLWALIIIKLFLLFVVLKMFFFPDVLKENYDTDYQRSEAVRSALTDRTPNNNQNIIYNE